MTQQKSALGRSVSFSIILSALLMCFAAGFMPQFAFADEAVEAQTDSSVVVQAEEQAAATTSEPEAVESEVPFEAEASNNSALDTAPEQPELTLNIDQSEPATLQPQDTLPGNPFNVAYGKNDNLRWEYDSTTKTIRLFLIDPSGDGHIPECNYGTPYFHLRTEVEHLIVDEGITTLGSCFTMQTTNLKSVSLPSTLTTVKSKAFYYAGGSFSVVFPSSLTTIEEQAFQTCQGVQAVYFPSTITYLPPIFHTCYNLKDIYLPSTLLKMDAGGWQFTETAKMQGVHFVGPPAPAPQIVGGTLSRYTVTAPVGSTGYTTANGFPAAAKMIYQSTADFGPNNEFSWSYTEDGTLTISGAGEVPEISDIPWSAYKDTVTRVVIAENITSIPTSIFKGYQNLATAILPSTLQEVGLDAFAGLPKLKKLQFNCEVAPVIEGQTANLMLATSPNAGIYIPSTATGYTAENGWPIDRIILGEGAFGPSNQFSWTLGATGVLTITGSGAMPDQSSGIPWAASAANIKQVRIAESITSVGAGAFSGCTQLATVSLPAGLTLIGASAFKDCASLTIPELPEALTSIGASAFSGCTSLALTALPTSLTTVGSEAFKGCTSLSLTDIPAGVTTINNSAFEGCTSITGDWDLSSLYTLGARAFAGCTNLQSVSFGSAFSTIGEAAFAGATALQSVNFAKNTAPAVENTAGSFGSAATLLEGTQAVFTAPYNPTNTSGFNLNTWDMTRLRLSCVTYTDESGIVQVIDDVRVLEAYASAANPTIESGWYLLNGVVGGNINFAGRLTISGDVKVILSSSKLIAPKGINVPEGSKLTIYSKVPNAPASSALEAGDVAGAGASGAGVDAGHAAIGGNKDSNTGVITIVGGNVAAKGGEGGAGIGAAQGGSIGTVEIKGGAVNATGGSGASGIGGANGAQTGTISIMGGNVVATGSGAPGVGAPAGTTGILNVNVLGAGHLEASNTMPGGVVVGSADRPASTNMDIGGIVIANTGTGTAPSRGNVGCTSPKVETGGAVLVVENKSDIVEAPGAITLKKTAVLLIDGYTDGVEVSPNPASNGAAQKLELAPTGEQKITLEPGGKLTFTNSANKRVTITAPEGANAAALTNITLTDRSQIMLPQGVTVAVDNKPISMGNSNKLSVGALGQAKDETAERNPNNLLKVGFNQAVTEIVDPVKGVLASDDLDRYSCGFGVSVWLEIKDEVSANDTAKVSQNLGSGTLGKALDISLWYKAEGAAEAQKVTSSEKAPIKVKFEIPEELLKFAKNIKRTFSILRVHDGVVSTLGTFKAEDLADGLAQFESTKFSTFALAYADEVIPEPAKPEDATGNTGNNTTDTTTDATTDANLSATPESPNTAGTWQQADSKVQARGFSAGAAPATGDNTPWVPVAPIAAALAALIAFAAFASRRSRMAA